MTGTTQEDLKATAFGALRDRAMSAGREVGFAEGVAFVKDLVRTMELPRTGARVDSPHPSAVLSDSTPDDAQPVGTVWDTAFQVGRNEGFGEGVQATQTRIAALPETRDGLAVPVEPMTENPQLPYGTSVESPKLDLTVRTFNCFKRDGIHNVGQLLKQSEASLLDISNFGWNSIDEVNEKLAAYGYKLAPSPAGFERP